MGAGMSQSLLLQWRRGEDEEKVPGTALAASSTAPNTNTALAPRIGASLRRFLSTKSRQNSSNTLQIVERMRNMIEQHLTELPPEFDNSMRIGLRTIEGESRSFDGSIDEHLAQELNAITNFVFQCVRSLHLKKKRTLSSEELQEKLQVVIAQINFYISTEAAKHRAYMQLGKTNQKILRCWFWFLAALCIIMQVVVPRLPIALKELYTPKWYHRLSDLLALWHFQDVKSWFIFSAATGGGYTQDFANMAINAWNYLIVDFPEDVPVIYLLAFLALLCVIIPKYFLYYVFYKKFDTEQVMKKIKEITITDFLPHVEAVLRAACINTLA